MKFLKLALILPIVASVAALPIVEGELEAHKVEGTAVDAWNSYKRGIYPPDWKRDEDQKVKQGTAVDACNSYKRDIPVDGGEKVKPGTAVDAWNSY
ncbi:MAG: hypothetical protein Q9226_001109 [Calogaya cf. arnoldii]